MVTIIAPAYLPTLPVPALIPSLLAQTDGDFEAILVHDGPCEAWDAWAAFCGDERIRFRSTRDRNEGWGHPIREMVLAEEVLNGRYVHLTNCDNYLVPTAVAKMNQQTADVVAWPIVHSYTDYEIMPPRLQLGAIDLCSVAVRTDLAKAIGFPYRETAGDFLYIQEVAKRTSSWVFLDSALSIHN